MLLHIASGSLENTTVRVQSQSVLIAEVDDLVRGACEYFLRREGLTVLDAQDGEDEMKVCDERTDKGIPLLLIDLKMRRT